MESQYDKIMRERGLSGALRTTYVYLSSVSLGYTVSLHLSPSPLPFLRLKADKLRYCIGVNLQRCMLRVFPMSINIKFCY
ncbi:MAG: hypothetical protein ACK4RM_10855 [Flavobacterium sp.]